MLAPTAEYPNSGKHLRHPSLALEINPGFIQCTTFHKQSLYEADPYYLARQQILYNKYGLAQTVFH